MNRKRIEKILHNCSKTIDESVNMVGASNEIVKYIEDLEQQVEYLRSSEYYNQLRFENKILQDVVDNGKVSKEDKEFIDCTHRNTELLEENQQLKERISYLERSIERKEENITELELERVPYTNDYVEKVKKENAELKKQIEYCYCNRTDCSSRIKNSKKYDSLVQAQEAQQKKFINYLEDKIYSIEPKGTGINYNCEYDSEEDYVMAMQEQSRLNTLKEILQKYKEIIGDNK